MGFLGDMVSVVRGVGDLFTGSSNDASANAYQMSQANADLQREFAQKGIRWRVEDAKAAGIHPLVAVGAQTHSASPSYVDGTDYNQKSKSEKWADFGNTIDRAIGATMTEGERLKQRLLLAQIRGQEIENDRKASELATTTQPGNPPAFPSMGDSGNVQVDASRRTSTMPGVPSLEAAISPATKAFINRDGTISIWPSKDAKESTEDSWYEYEHMYRNRLLPYLSDKWESAKGYWDKVRRLPVPPTRRF